jgi:hypothetical protein
MKKILTIFFCTAVFTLSEYWATELLKRLFISGYYTAQSFIEVWNFSAIFGTITTILILSFSYFIRKQAANNSIQKIGLKIGLLSFISWFVFMSSISIGGYNFPLIFGLALVHFVFGFSFPIIYKWLNKKPLFNESFY